MKQPSPWQPETNKLRLAILGKLGEELGEAGAIVNRCVIQGIEESEPVTGRVNAVALTEEIADVLAAADIAIDHFRLDRGAINLRIARKRDHLKGWHKLITD